MRKFDVNGLIWRVCLCSPHNPMLSRGDGTFALGVCDNNVQTIFINHRLPPRKLWDVLIHEIVHATLFTYGYNLNSYCHEELIANFIELYGEDIIDDARNIYSQIINETY